MQLGVNVWPYELKTAQAFTACGLDVEFVRHNEGERMTSADAIPRIKRLGYINKHGWVIDIKG